MAKKVLHIIQGFGPGGAETWLLSTVKYLNNHPEIGLQFDFLASGGERSMFDAEVESYGSKIFYIKYSIGSILGFRKQFIKVLNENKYDAIHDHQDFISGWHFLSASGNLPSIRLAHLHNPYNFVHNYTTNLQRWLSFKMGRLLTVSLATGITATSNAVMDEYGYNKWPYKNKRLYPAYCGFDVSAFQYNPLAKDSIVKEFGLASSSKIALFVGRIGTQPTDNAKNQKNPDFAFDFAKQLVSKYTEWKFLFVGYKGAYGEELEMKTAELELSDKIIFTGLRKDIPRIMSAADVLIFPSLWEGLGMVAVEAQASGLPVLMSDSIPAEANINHVLVKTMSLREPVSDWVDAAVSISERKTDRPAAVNKIEQSPFSIHNSISKLFEYYSA